MSKASAASSAIPAIQPNMSTCLQEGVEPCEALLKWFKAQPGAQLAAPLRVSASPYGNGLFAKSDLAKDTSILRVPAHICIHPQAAVQGIAKLLSIDFERTRQALCTHNLGSREAIVLYVALADHLCKLNDRLQHRAEQCSPSSAAHFDGPDAMRAASKRLKPQPCWPSSDHDAYIRALPRHFLLPIFYTSSELRLFRYSPIESHALRCLERYAVLAGRASAALASLDFQWDVGEGFEEPDSLLNAWRWSDACYTSRAFPPRLLSSNPRHAEQADNDDAPVLIPVLDLLNHQAKQPVTWIAGREIESDGDGTAPPIGTAASPQAEQASDDNVSKPADRPMRSDGVQDWALRRPPDDAYVELILHTAVNEGSEVCNNYGYKSGEEFLASYGFVGEYHAVSLRLVAADTDAQRTKPSGRTHYWDGLSSPDSLLGEISTQCTFDYERARAHPRAQAFLERKAEGLGQERLQEIIVRGLALHSLKTLLEGRCERLLKQCKRITRTTGLCMSKCKSSADEPTGIDQEGEELREQEMAQLDFLGTPDVRLQVALLARKYTMGQVDCILRCLDWVDNQRSSSIHSAIIEDYLEAAETDDVS